MLPRPQDLRRSTIRLVAIEVNTQLKELCSLFRPQRRFPMPVAKPQPMNTNTA